VAANAVIGAVESGSPAPSTATCQLTVDFDHKVRAIFHKLYVDSHDCVTRSYLLWIEKVLLQLVDRSFDERHQSGDVVQRSNVTCHGHRDSSIALVPWAIRTKHLVWEQMVVIRLRDC
jgi:hypothetical protein